MRSQEGKSNSINYTIQRATWDNPILTGPQKLVMLCLINHRNAKDESCFPSMDRISKQTGMSKRTCQYAIKYLAQEGYIAIDNTRHPTPNYMLYPGRISPGGCKSCTGGVQELHPNHLINHKAKTRTKDGFSNLGENQDFVGPNSEQALGQLMADFFLTREQ